jgi:hypothetical protein
LMIDKNVIFYWLLFLLLNDNTK